MKTSRPSGTEDHSEPITKFLRNPDVTMRHKITIDAPADLVFDVAEHFDLQSIPTIRFLFRLRELLLLIRPKPRPQLKALVSETMKLGWIRLDYAPPRHLIMGAVAQPWFGNIDFKPLTPDEFSNFSEPGFIKIVWTLEADPIERRTTLFRTQTYVAATSSAARKWFRLYWAFAGYFVSLIRILGLRAIRREAERRLL